MCKIPQFASRQKIVLSLEQILDTPLVPLCFDWDWITIWIFLQVASPCFFKCDCTAREFWNGKHLTEIMFYGDVTGQSFIKWKSRALVILNVGFKGSSTTALFAISFCHLAPGWNDFKLSSSFFSFFFFSSVSCLSSLLWSIHAASLYIWSLS